MTIDRKRSISTSKPRPTYSEEEVLLNEGYSLVAGLDEVGRGPLAGPVLAATVVLSPRPKGCWVGMIRDSKQLTSDRREFLVSFIRDTALMVSVGISTPLEIDRLGIVACTRLAMQRSLDSLPLFPQFLLVDALHLPDVPIPQKAIIRGDAYCLSIAAASIVAKVARDRIMIDEDQKNPGYGFANHKGYATREHLRNLQRLGPSSIHRRSFAPIRQYLEPGGIWGKETEGSIPISPTERAQKDE